MQNRNKAKYSLTSSTAKLQKAVNSSLDPTNTPTVQYNSVVKSASYKTLSHIRAPITGRKDGVSMAKVSKFTPSHHSSFDSGNIAKGSSTNASANTRKECLQNELKSKINFYTNQQTVPTVKSRRGPAKVKQSIYCPSKAMREQYLLDTLRPYNAEQIIANTGRPKGSEKVDVKGEKKYEMFGQFNTEVKRKEEIRPQIGRFLEKPAMGNGKPNGDGAKKSLPEAKCLINAIRITPITTASMTTNNSKVGSSIFLSITKPPSNSSATTLNHYATHDGKKLSLSLSALSPKELEEPSFKCNCKRDSELPCCVKAGNWLRSTYNHRRCAFDYPKHKSLYESLVHSELEKGINSPDWQQIKRDLNRTFPHCPFFAEGSNGQAQLERVLVTFTKYDPKIGYVQGMNFIVGALLYHCSEEIAFWLFVSLVEDHEMRDIFLPGLPGLYKHTQIIDMLILENLHAVYQHFCNHGIKVEMFATEWIFTLFSCIISIEQIDSFFDEFFKEAWIFFYKFIIHLLKVNERTILATDDISEMMSPIKDSRPKGGFNKLLSSLPFFSKVFRQTSWLDLIRGCKKEKINEGYVKELLGSYDLDNLRFKCVSSIRK